MPISKPARISYEEYKTIANMLIWQVQHSEGEDGGGMRRSEVINWYLKEIESDISSVGELADRKALVEKIIDRLMHHVSNCHGNHSDHYHSTAGSYIVIISGVT